MSDRMLHVCFVLGEESGDALAADLWPAMQAEAKRRGLAIEASGLAGPRLKDLGVESLFDISDIAVMGIADVAVRLPRIVRRVHQTVDAIVERKPDLVLLVDSPDFTHAVGKRVRARLPDVPIVKYVCPSVWAWRPGRAAKMTAFIDHVLTLLPFEPGVLKRLGGPDSTYVGHPLVSHIHGVPNVLPAGELPNLLVLPGSRKSEIKRMMPLFGKALGILENRGVTANYIIPAIPHLRTQIEDEIRSSWTVKPLLVDSSENDRIFADAHAALSTSGTVLLQLALHRVPMVSAYRLDPVARRLRAIISTWSAALPNLIADWPIVREYYDEFAQPEMLARELQRLLTDTPERAAQLAGFETVIENMKTDLPSSEAATRAIFSVLERKNPDLSTGI